jgi:hypothetical protein
VGWRKYFLIVVLLCFLPSVVTHVILWQVEGRLQLHVTRRPLFHLVPGTISIPNLACTWGDELEVLSGSVVIRYPVSALLRTDFKITLEGEKLNVVLKGDLRDTLGVDRLMLDTVSADLRVTEAEGIDVERLDAVGKNIEFHLAGQDALI